MSFGIENKIEIRHRALLEAVRFCGGVTAYSQQIKVNRSRASNWINQPEIEIPYEYVVLTEDITRVSVERLSPFTEAANKLVRRLRSNDVMLPVSILLSEVLMGDHFYLKWQRPDRPILIGTDGVLISGLIQIEKLRALGIKKTQAIIIDLEALLLETRCIQDMNLKLFISEQVAIGLRMEKMLGNRKGQKNNRKNINLSDKNVDKNFASHSIGDKVGRVDSYIARLMDIGKGTYHRAREVYLKGNLELISAMDLKEISIAKAAKKIEMEKNSQLNSVLTTSEGVK